LAGYIAKKSIRMLNLHSKAFSQNKQEVLI